MTDHTPQWVTDDELIKLSGVPKDRMQRILDTMDADRLSGFPQKNKFYGNRRYWPAVLKYWELMNQLPSTLAPVRVEYTRENRSLERVEP